MRAFGAALVLAAAALLPPSGAGAGDEGARATHGIAIHGEPSYPPDFRHFKYVNPLAPKGGTIRRSAFGTFDNLNPFILKGVSAAALGYQFETLMEGSLDEASTEYGRIAETVETPADRSWVAFNLRPEARWHDGRPITVEDVIFTFETLKAKGHPFYRAYYGSVAKAEQVGPRKVKFTFSGGENRELPVIVGQLPVLAKHYWEGREFDKTTLDPPLGSGPYRIESVDPGRSITYRRVADWWGKDLPVNVGFFNADLIRFEYYRDRTVEREAFKAGEFDFFEENTAKDWATAYDFPAIRDGLVRKEEIGHEIPTGLQAFVFNTRRPFFQDRRVRQAIGYAFDFEWTNKVLFYGQYTRTRSYFSNSELASRGPPEGAELAVLAPFRGRVPEEVFASEYAPPGTDGTGNIRDNLRQAFRLLAEAGWVVRDYVLVDAQGGRPFEFEILLVSPAFERIALAFARNLERLGVRVRVRTVDPSQYQNRVDAFDFDMVVGSFGQSLSPGNEQRDFWTTVAADTKGSRNLIGLKDPVVDELVELVIAAPDRVSLIARTRALDRVLLWGHYVVPQWHIRTFRLVYWDKFGRPAVRPKYSLALDSWWVDQAKEDSLALGRQRIEAE